MRELPPPPEQITKEVSGEEERGHSQTLKRGYPAIYFEVSTAGEGDLSSDILREKKTKKELKDIEKKVSQKKKKKETQLSTSFPNSISHEKHRKETNM